MNCLEELRQDAEMWKQRLASAIKDIPSPWNPSEKERARINYLQGQAQMATKKYQASCCRGLSHDE
jgi:hypothetical protein